MEKSIADVTLQCFGGFNLQVDGEYIHHFSTEKTRALLIYLAIEAPKQFRRSHLAGLLWSDFTEQQALHNLRQTLFWLKKAIPRSENQPALITSEKDMIGINPEIRLWVDVRAFEQHYDQAMKFSSQDEQPDHVNISQLKTAIDIFAGPFLDRFNLDDTCLFDEWMLTVRENSNQKAVELTSILCKYYERRGDYKTASNLADRIITLTPWDESAYFRSMNLHALRKQWANAEKRYWQLKSYLQENFSIEPAVEISDLFRQIRKLSIQEGSLLPLFARTPHNLPKFTSDFVGRHFEMTKLGNLLPDPRIRLVTILGIGGIGKTRLAVELANLLDGLYLDGVFFIGMQEFLTSDGFIHTLAEKLNLSFSTSSSHQKQLLDFMREKRTLLILDGFEHVLSIPGVRELVSDLFRNTSGVKIMVTSRERLNLKEEHIFRLGGLITGLNVDMESFKPSEAISLFLERVESNHQEVILQEQHDIIQKLCQFVDGHPLSIELIASVAYRHRLPDLLNDLEAGLLRLESPFIDAIPEQRNLAVVLESSWHNLTEVEQILLCKLSCFRGSFTEDAALAVSQSKKEVFSSLIGKSLIETANYPRYNLHEIVRQFASQKNTDVSQQQKTYQLHADYYLTALAEIGERNPHQFKVETLDQIEDDLQNFLSAWNYFLDRDEINKIVQNIEPLYQFFNIRSRFQEGIDLFQNAFNKVQNILSADLLRVNLANRIGMLAHRSRHKELAFEMFSLSQHLAETSGNIRELGIAYTGLGEYYLRVKQFKDALHYANQGFSIFQEVDDLGHLSAACELIGLIHNRTADFRRAKEMLARSIEISRQINDQRGLISSLNQMGDLACNDGHFEDAEKYFLESLALSRLFKDRFNQAILLNNLASIYHPLGDYDQEEAVLIESLKICKEIGDRDGEAIALNNLGELAVVRGEFIKAIQYCQQAMEISITTGEEWTTIVIYDILGEAYWGLQNIQDAKRSFIAGLTLAYQIDAWDLVTRLMINSAKVYHADEGPETAKMILIAALSHSGLLFEFKDKGLALLKTIGGKMPENPNDDLLKDCLEKILSL